MDAVWNIYKKIKNVNYTFKIIYLPQQIQKEGEYFA